MLSDLVSEQEDGSQLDIGEVLDAEQFLCQSGPGDPADESLLDLIAELNKSNPRISRAAR